MLVTAQTINNAEDILVVPQKYIHVPAHYPRLLRDRLAYKLTCDGDGVKARDYEVASTDE